MRFLRVMLVVTSLGLILSGCSSDSTAEADGLCVAHTSSTSSSERLSRNLGNTNEYANHEPILSPEVSWELTLDENVVVPYRLPAFNHLIGLVTTDSGGSRIDFIDGLLGIPTRSDDLPPDSTLVEIADSEMLIVTATDQLYLYDLGTGRIVWGFQENQSLRFAPVIAGDKAILMNGTSQGDRGEVLAIDLNSGEAIWSGKTPIVEGYTYPISSAAVAVTDGAVIVNGFGWFYAFDIESGEKCWDTESSKYGLASQFNIPSTNGEVVLFEAEGDLYSLSVSDGDILWQTSGFKPFSNIAISSDSAVSVGDEGELVSVDLSDGEVQWSRTDFDYSYAELLIADNVVYATTDSGELNALELDTGKVIWTMEVGDVNTQLYATKNGVYVLTDERLICIVNRPS